MLLHVGITGVLEQESHTVELTRAEAVVDLHGLLDWECPRHK